MNNNLEKIRSLCKTDDFTGNSSDEYLFTINCVDYFFYGKNIGQVDIMDGFTDGAGDGGIDFIYEDGTKLYLIQGKSSSDLTYNDIRDLFCKINETVNNFKVGKIDDYSSKLKEKYMNTLGKLTNPDLEYVLFTNTNVSDDLIRKVNDLNTQSSFNDVQLTVYGGEEIETQRLNTDDGNMTIDEGKLEVLSKEHLEYKDGKGAIFTIKASSLKDLYNRYSQRGLFGYNLREHITQKTVDTAIDKTIENDKDNFWFFNNGITIGCSDYTLDGKMLKVYDFSIINGAQTTTKIGNSKLIKPDNDFCLVCKLIKSEKSLDDDFIRSVSEASNSQKPIRPRDLKANSNEQKTLQNRLIDNSNSLCMEIKRGVKPSNYKRVESWQRVTNEYVGQILLATQYQQPGTARSAKSDIFGKDNTYNLLFSKDKVKKYDCDTIYDMVRIAHYYDEFRVDYVQKNNKTISLSETSDVQKKKLNNINSVCSNAKFVTIALISYFYKKLILGISGTDDDNFEKPIITGKYTMNYDKDDYFDKLNYLFKFIVDKLTIIYDNNEVQLKLTSHSNFFKTDSNYKKVIIPEFDLMLEDEYDKDKILDNMKLFIG